MQLSVVDKKGQAADEGMDKIRELLFGQQLQGINEQLTRLEAHLENGIGQLRDELRKATSQEAAAREKDNKALGERLDQLETELAGELQSLRAQTGQRFDDLDTQVSSQHKELFGALDKEGDRLQREKVGREAMSDLLLKLASSLREGKG